MIFKDIIALALLAILWQKQDLPISLDMLGCHRTTGLRIASHTSTTSLTVALLRRLIALERLHDSNDTTSLEAPRFC